MDEKLYLRIERAKANIEKAKAHLAYWQTKILSGVDKSWKAHENLWDQVQKVELHVKEVLSIRKED